MESLLKGFFINRLELVKIENYNRVCNLLFKILAKFYISIYTHQDCDRILAGSTFWLLVYKLF